MAWHSLSCFIKNFWNEVFWNLYLFFWNGERAKKMTKLISYMFQMHFYFEISLPWCFPLSFPLCIFLPSTHTLLGNLQSSNEQMSGFKRKWEFLFFSGLYAYVYPVSREWSHHIDCLQNLQYSYTQICSWLSVVCGIKWFVF